MCLASALTFTSCGDDPQIIYVDGKLAAINPTEGNKNIVAYVPQNAQLLAVAVTNIYGYANLKGALTNGTMITDGSWKCTATYADGWHKIGFDDSSWPVATVRDASLNGAICEDFPSGAIKSLWNDFSGSYNVQKTVYCRKSLQPGA